MRVHMSFDTYSKQAKPHPTPTIQPSALQLSIQGLLDFCLMPFEHKKTVTPLNARVSNDESIRNSSIYGSVQRAACTIGDGIQ